MAFLKDGELLEKLSLLLQEDLPRIKMAVIRIWASVSHHPSSPQAYLDFNVFPQVERFLSSQENDEYFEVALECLD